MSITGLPLLILFVLLTAAAFAGTVLLWPRLSGRNWRAVLGRLGLLGGVQLCLVITFLLLVNSYYSFYTSWGQLFGIGGSSSGYTASTPTAAEQLTVQRLEDVGVPDGDDPAKAGQLQQVVIHGARSGLSASAYVYLPPQYFQARYQHDEFPAAIVSTGYPGNVEALVNRLRYPVKMTTGIDTGRIRPMVLVMVSPMVVQGRDTECVDVPGGPQAATYWSVDIPDAVSAAYRVMPGAAGWGLIGDSTGGYCAAKLAMTESNHFRAAVSLSGYYAALQDITTGDLYGGSAAFRTQNDLLWRVQHLPPPPVSLLLTTSRVGEDNYQDTLEFAKLARPPLRVTTLIRAEGGHNFQTWNSEIPEGLHWLSLRLAPFGPA
jgi:enterochelin esterase-like enzyme